MEKKENWYSKMLEKKKKSAEELLKKLDGVEFTGNKKKIHDGIVSLFQLVSKEGRTDEENKELRQKGKEFKKEFLKAKKK